MLVVFLGHHVDPGIGRPRPRPLPPEPGLRNQCRCSGAVQIPSAYPLALASPDFRPRIKAIQQVGERHNRSYKLCHKRRRKPAPEAFVSATAATRAPNRRPPRMTSWSGTPRSRSAAYGSERRRGSRRCPAVARSREGASLGDPHWDGSATIEPRGGVSAGMHDARRRDGRWPRLIWRSISSRRPVPGGRALAVRGTAYALAGAGERAFGPGARIWIAAAGGTIRADNPVDCEATK